MICLKEVFEADKRRKLRRAIKLKQETETAQAIEAMIDEYLAGAGDDETRDMISQFYQAGGDKHRLTRVNISAVKNWFQPELLPVCDKSIVPCRGRAPATKQRRATRVTGKKTLIKCTRF